MNTISSSKSTYGLHAAVSSGSPPTNPFRTTCRVSRHESVNGYDVDVWCIPLKQPPYVVGRLQRLLSRDEHRRARRFRFEKHREGFVVARGALREILGGYLTAQPEELSFVYNRWGKPSLADEPPRTPIRFNVSHSGGLCLIAVTCCVEVGIDLEMIREDVEREKVAELFFSPRERKILRELPASLKRTAFFDCWTRKEAYVKGLGAGVSVPLDRFDVSLVPGEPASLLHVEWDPEEASRWYLCELNLGFGYAATLAVGKRYGSQARSHRCDF